MDTEQLLRELVQSGLFTDQEAAALVAKKGAMELGQMIVKSVTSLSTWPVEQIMVRTEAWTITWVKGRLTVSPVRPRSKPLPAAEGQSQAKATDVAGIPAEIWRQACADLGVKYFGPSAAQKSSRVRQHAVELAKAKGIVA